MKKEPDYIEIEWRIRCDGWWRKAVIGAVLFIICYGAIFRVADLIRSWR